MTKNAEQFLEIVSNDAALKAELTAALQGLENADQIPALVEIANKKGYALTTDDFLPDEENVSPDELYAITGGGGCGCAIFGVGSGDGLDCGCGFGGYGDVHGQSKSQGMCICPAAGVGATRRH